MKSRAVFAPHPGLLATTRLPLLATGNSPSVHFGEWCWLLGMGVLAAVASAYWDWQIKQVPGHAILRMILPLGIGFAIVPRYGAGCVMGASAGITAIVIRIVDPRGEATGIGAMTSLMATGPIIDLWLSRSRGGWWQVPAFCLAGVTSNLLALLVRGVAKVFGWEPAGKQPVAIWFSRAIGSYVVCGLLAGLIIGCLLFRFRPRLHRESGADDSLTTPASPSAATAESTP